MTREDKDYNMLFKPNDNILQLDMLYRDILCFLLMPPPCFCTIIYNFNTKTTEAITLKLSHTKFNSIKKANSSLIAVLGNF